MDIDTEKIYEIIYGGLTFVPDFAKNVYQSRIASAASVCHTEEERNAVIQAGEDISYQIVRDGSTFSVRTENGDHSLAAELVDKGKPIPYQGGDHGTVTEIDGSTRPSRVPAQLLENPQPLPEYSWEATNFTEEANKILETSLPSMFSDAITSAASQIGRDVIAPSVAKELQRSWS